MDSMRLYTCIVGKKPTHANFYVNEVSEVEAVVAKMAGTDVAHEGQQGVEGGASEGGGGVLSGGLDARCDAPAG